jgi:hypothetical protein
MKLKVFWDVVPRSHVEANRRFRGAYFIIRAIIEALLTSETSVIYNALLISLEV